MRQPQSAQLSLWMLAEAEQSKSGKRGRYDGQTFKRLYPAEHAMVVEMLSKGVFSKRDISRQVECAWETVIAISLEHEAEIRAGKRGMIKTLELVLAYSGDELVERAKRGDVSPLEHAILVDKHQLLSGGVTERVGHVLEEDPDVAEFRRLAQAKDVTPMALEMGSGVGNLLQEGALGTLPEEAPVIDLVPLKPASEDGESPDKEAQQIDPEA